MNGLRIGAAALVLSVGCTSIGSAGADEKSILQMDLSTGRPIVQAHVLAQGPFKVIVDTGGPNGVSGGIAADVADALSLPQAGKMQMRSPAAGGAPLEVDLHQAATIVFGNYRVNGVTLLRRTGSSPFPGADMLVGTAIFGQSGKVLELDFAAKELRLVPAPTAAVTHWQPINAESGHLHTTITIGGKSFAAALDTGSPAQLTVPKSVMDQLPLTEKPKVVGRARTVDSSFDLLGAPLAADVSLGEVSLSVTEVTSGPFPRVVVGTAALKGVTVVVDWKNMRFGVARPKAT